MRVERRQRAACAAWRVALALATLATPLAASAQTKSPNGVRADGPVEGTVLAVEGGDLVVDLAAARGAHDGDLIELWRPIALRHPVTRQTVSDRFLIGQLRLKQVRDTLALATEEGTLEREPVVGDVVVLRVARAADEIVPAPPQPQQEPLQCAPQLEPTACDGEAQEVAALFASLWGKRLVDRVVAYEGYARARPRSRFAPVLVEEAQHLRHLAARTAREIADRSIAAVAFSPPADALAGEPLTVALELNGPVAGAVLHARHDGEVGYVSHPLAKSGAGYWRVTVPAEAMKGPDLEYFIEAVSERGKATAVVGSAERPLALDVRDIPQPDPPPEPLAIASVWTDYADYNRFRGNDRVWQTEGFVGLRLDDTGVRALRTGFGVYRGVGGSLEELDEFGKSGRRVGLTYGYLEGEIGFVHLCGLVLRGVVGLEDGGVTGGGQALVRIGNDLETNLLLGGEFLGGVGLRGIAQLDLAVLDDWPMMLRTEVTNQPAGSGSSTDDVLPADDVLPSDAAIETNQIGARGIVQVGYRIVEPLTIAVRGSYQGRTIKHSGPGFGGAVSYTW